MHIIQSGKPSIHMITEAGIIGKIGLNSVGVGVTLNAVMAKGVTFNKLPCHLALRTVLNSNSRKDAVSQLQRAGVASSCHINVADATGGVGLECSGYDIVELPMRNGVVAHTNHFIESHASPSKIYLPDTPFRLERVQQLIRDAGDRPNLESLEEILKDEKNYPGAICRGPTEKSSVETLFSVVMDLGARTSRVKVGRPTEATEVFILSP